MHSSFSISAFNYLAGGQQSYEPAACVSPAHKLECFNNFQMVLKIKRRILFLDMEITWNWNLRFLSFTGTNMPTSLCTVCSWFHETTAEQSSCNRDRLAHRAYVIYYLAHSEHVCWLLIEAIFFPSHHEKLRTDFRLKHMGEKQPLARQSRRGRKDRCPSGFFFRGCPPTVSICLRPWPLDIWDFHIPPPSPGISQPHTSPPTCLSEPRFSHTNLFGTSMFLETGR